MNRQKPVTDFIGLIFLTILLNFLIFFEITGFLRNVLGLTFIILFPGYVLQATLFPTQNDLKIIERAVLSFVLSVAVVSLLGLTLNFTPWGIKLHSFMVTLTLYISALSLIGIYRRSNLTGEQGLAIKKTKAATLTKCIGKNKVFSVVLVGAVAFALFSIYSLVAAPRYDGFTEFYILTSDKKAQDYSDLDFIVGVVNYELKGSQYSIKIQADGLTKKYIGPFYLECGKKFEERVRFFPPADYKGSKIECILFKNDNEQAYRTLHIWINEG